MIYYVRVVGCFGCGNLVTLDVGDVECWEYRMLGMWDDGEVEF